MASPPNPRGDFYKVNRIKYSNSRHHVTRLIFKGIVHRENFHVSLSFENNFTFLSFARHVLLFFFYDVLYVLRTEHTVDKLYPDRQCISSSQYNYCSLYRSKVVLVILINLLEVKKIRGIFVKKSASLISFIQGPAARESSCTVHCTAAAGSVYPPTPPI